MEFLGKALFLAFAAAVIYGLWRLGRPPRLFVVRLTNGEPAATTGSVTVSFLDVIREIAAEHGIVAGRLWGVVVNEQRVRLEFSREFPPSAQQKLRNWWGISGWKPRRSRV